MLVDRIQRDRVPKIETSSLDLCSVIESKVESLVHCSVSTCLLGEVLSEPLVSFQFLALSNIGGSFVPRKSHCLFNGPGP